MDINDITKQAIHPNLLKEPPTDIPIKIHTQNRQNKERIFQDRNPMKKNKGIIINDPRIRGTATTRKGDIKNRRTMKWKHQSLQNRINRNKKLESTGLISRSDKNPRLKNKFHWSNKSNLINNSKSNKNQNNNNNNNNNNNWLLELIY